MNIFNLTLAWGMLLLVSACTSATTSASQYTYKGKTYIVVNSSRSGLYTGGGSLDVMARNNASVLKRNSDGKWVKVGDEGFADIIISGGTFQRRLDSTKIKTSESGVVKIPNSELNDIAAEDIQGD
jgi:hypothetical protein